MEVQEVKEQLKSIFRQVINNDKWITIHPNGEDEKGKHLLLKDGESPKEAIERTYGKGEKSDTKDGKEETKKEYPSRHAEILYKDLPELREKLHKAKYERAKNKEKGADVSLYDKRIKEYEDKEQQLKDEMAELRDNRRSQKERYTSLIEEQKQSDTKEENKDKYIGKKFFIGDREDEITEYLPQFDRYMGKNPEGLNWGAQLYTKEDLDKFVKSDGEYLEEKELREKQKVEREQAQKQKEEEKKATQAEYMRDNGFTEGMTDLQKGKTLKDLNKEVWYKQINDGKPTTSKKMIEELIGKGFKPKEETFRTSKKINGERIDKDTVSKILEDKDGNFYKLNSTEYKYAQYLQDKGKDIVGVVMPIDAREQSYSKTVNNEIEEELTEDKNQLKLKIDNSKEQDMALIEELKKLITKVENTKGEEEMEIENEKVDKRKLIDEVGGILKGKVDDEVIRTIIGKMEKMSYDDSEASADNKKVKNEAEEEEEKKVDNEDEEDEEKVEELKEEEKKDVDNKCKNSKEENYFDKLNKIYNSAKKIEEPSADYESKQARLEAGKEYFG